MKFIASLAAKNLFRYYKRTILTAVSIALGVGLFISGEALLRWGNNMSLRNLKNYETASMKIGNSDFFEEEEYLPLDKTLEDRDKVESLLKQKGLEYTPEVKFRANLINDASGESYPFIGLAIDPESHNDVYKLKDAVYKGNFVRQGKQIIVSKYTSDLLNLKLGDYVIIEADTKFDLHNADAFKIVGIFETPNPEVNRNNFFIPMDAANTFLEMEGEVSQLSIKSDTEGEKTQLLATDLTKEIKSMGMSNIDVKSWRDLAQGYLAISQGDKGGTAIILFMVFIIVTVGIANTMLMAVYERTGEIGMMRAMGTTKKEIMWSFILESGGIGFLGGILGVILGAGLDWYLIEYGWDFSSWIGDMSFGYRTAAVFRAEWNPEMMLFALIFSIVCAAVISIFPARRALKMSISETLTHVERFG